eukprot:3792265-Rhodomonas_salina.2
MWVCIIAQIAVLTSTRMRGRDAFSARSPTALAWKDQAHDSGGRHSLSKLAKLAEVFGTARNFLAQKERSRISFAALRPRCR